MLAGTADGLRDGVGGVWNLSRIGRVIGVEHDAAVTRDQQTVEAVGLAVGNQFRQRRRIHALSFRRRYRPLGHRPDRLAGLREAIAASRSRCDGCRQNELQQRDSLLSHEGRHQSLVRAVKSEEE